MLHYFVDNNKIDIIGKNHPKLHVLTFFYNILKSTFPFMKTCYFTTVQKYGASLLK